MKKLILPFSLIFLILSCSQNKSQKNISENDISSEMDSSKNISKTNPNGLTINTRFNLPNGFTRVENGSNSFENYLQNLPLKKDGSLTHLYNGSIKENTGIYLAVVDLPIGKKDLHQCADAVMRLRAEYLFSQKKYDEISFLTASGKQFKYVTWLNGKEPNKINFWNYLEALFNVANTTSLNKQLKSKPIQKLEIGDVFIYPWQGQMPGHAIIVVDKCINSEGKVKFMLAQSFMPAQEIQILNNPNENGSPWYDLNFGETLDTPEIDFSKNLLKCF
ncbi:MAG: hypothetical protein FJZ67_04155 [Bacteroidetes bacterium]|nr:hypothetical protein [Bacteroidota bacterium]